MDMVTKPSHVVNSVQLGFKLTVSLDSESNTSQTSWQEDPDPVSSTGQDLDTKLVSKPQGVAFGLRTSK